jgi:hypothetical protein
MKRLALLCVAVLCLCGAAGANEALSLNEPWPCLYLFEDLPSCDPCVYGTGYFSFYCCALAGYRPMGTLLFSISLSSDNLELSDVIFAPEVTVISGGDLPGDVEASIACDFYEWNVVFTATVFVGADSEDAVVIGPFTGETTPLAIANDGTEEVLHCLDLMINNETCNPVSVDGSSWGAVKSLYR